MLQRGQAIRFKIGGKIESSRHRFRTSHPPVLAEAPTTRHASDANSRTCLKRPVRGRPFPLDLQAACLQNDRPQNIIETVANLAETCRGWKIKSLALNCHSLRATALLFFVPLFDRHILHRRRAKRVESSARRFHGAGNIFEPCLVGRDLDSLARLRSAPCLDDALTALPGEFVIVPDATNGQRARASCRSGSAR
jgi:hypothetical protein